MLHMHTTSTQLSVQKRHKTTDNVTTSHAVVIWTLRHNLYKKYKLLEPSFLHHYHWYLPSLTILLPTSEEIRKF